MKTGVMDLSVFFFKQKTAYEMRISDWSSDVCSSDLSVSGKQRLSIPDYAYPPMDGLLVFLTLFVDEPSRFMLRVACLIVTVVCAVVKVATCDAGHFGSKALARGYGLLSRSAGSIPRT